MNSPDLSLYIYDRLHELAKVLDKKEFRSRAEELIHLLLEDWKCSGSLSR